MLKYLASVPIVLSVLAGAYGTLNYANKLTTQIDDSTKEIMMLRKDIENIHQIYTEKTNVNSDNYSMAREELLKEMTSLNTWVGRIEAKGQAMEKLMYETSSQAEYQALEEIVRTNSNAIQQFKYDMKDLERQLSGGY
jgi:predicted  nucleic acid-binding Zn-ribbon protein|tara:strand:- start:413 stop:826 length:414 start_codon:yes stop_codon:yes gene_type:complete